MFHIISAQAKLHVYRTKAVSGKYTFHFRLMANMFILIGPYKYGTRSGTFYKHLTLN